ncbi:MAG: hypothetical protein LBU20_00445 [Candidatus Nomurabacteria bacterium]|jgi:hypothetical protein|nr:hypothetical protein [Candidatus Nomurabacteria bacterium]
MKRVIKSWRTVSIGIKKAANGWQFWLSAVGATLFFIFLFNLLSSGNNFLQLLINLPFGDKFFVIGQVYWEFLTNFLSIEKILIFLAAAGQGLIISMIVFLWRTRRRLDDTAVLESASASLIALIGAGCPVCGGTILLPVLMSLFGASAMTFLQSFSLLLMAAALAPIIFAIRRLGFLSSMQPKAKSRKESNAES